MKKILKKEKKYYTLGGITLQVESDLPVANNTFHQKFKNFEISAPENDPVIIRHNFSVPFSLNTPGQKIYDRENLKIYRNGNLKIYSFIDEKKSKSNKIAVFNKDFSRLQIYTDKVKYRKGNLNSLTAFEEDEILLSLILAEKEGFFINSTGVIYSGQGFLFLGSRENIKSLLKTLGDKVELLCDRRIIIRKFSDSFRIYGTWHPEESPKSSSSSAPLKRIYLLNKTDYTGIVPLICKDTREKLITDCLLKTPEENKKVKKIMELIYRLINTVPFYNLNFDESPKAIKLFSF